MRLNRQVRIQLAVFTVITVTACAIMVFHYINVPALFFGVGRYTVTVELDRASGLYPNGNVSYRGSEIGRIERVRLTRQGVEAVLSLRSDTDIPSDVRAEVHSKSAIGEQYVELVPLGADVAPLKEGDVIPVDHTSVPPDIASLLDAVNQGLTALPQGNLKTVIDESYLAVGGLGPDLSRLVKGSNRLAIDSRDNLDSLTNVIDHSQPLLAAQADTADSINAWAASLASITDQLRGSDQAVAGLLERGGPAADETRRLFERLRPSLPLLLANLVSIGQVAITYQPAIEQLLVLLPQGVANLQGVSMANLNTKQDYKGLFLDFNLNLNLPPVCATGFLPPQQQRAPALQDYPDRPEGDLYCRVPQDSPFNVRGARNYPCLGVPGKRAPTAKMCESNDQYEPLNDGYNWKGDPNATLSGQDVPQVLTGVPSAPNPEPPQAPAPPSIAAAEYDPATGTYIGPDGHAYTQSDLSNTAPKEQTWQSMLMPPTAG